MQVERGVRILDSPGVVFDDDEQANSNVLLRNVVKVEDMTDPIAVGMFSIIAFIDLCSFHCSRPNSNQNGGI